MTDLLAWCEVDDCPATICNGPHVNHACADDTITTSHINDLSPCPFCGAAPGG